MRNLNTDNLRGIQIREKRANLWSYTALFRSHWGNTGVITRSYAKDGEFTLYIGDCLMAKGSILTVRRKGRELFRNLTISSLIYNSHQIKEKNFYARPHFEPQDSREVYEEVGQFQDFCEQIAGQFE